MTKTMRIRQGCAGGGGKGPLLQDEKSATLGTSNDQYLFEDKMKIYDESVRARLMENEDVAPTVMSHYGTGGGQRAVCKPR